MMSGDSVFPVFCVLVALLEMSFWAFYVEVRGLVRLVPLRIGVIVLHLFTTTLIFSTYTLLGAEITSSAWIFAIIGARLIDITPLWISALEAEKSSQNKK